MNGIDKITARIVSDAAEEAAQAAQENAAECAKLRAESDKAAQEHYWACMKQGMKAVDDRAARLAAAAGMEAKKTILAFKQETVATVFDEARRKILSLPRADYIRFLTDKAVSVCATGREELVFNAADRDTVADEVVVAANEAMEKAGKPAELTVAAETGAFSGGLIARQGKVAYNCTVEALMEQARESMTSAVAQLLFG